MTARADRSATATPERLAARTRWRRSPSVRAAWRPSRARTSRPRRFATLTGASSSPRAPGPGAGGAARQRGGRRGWGSRVLCRPALASRRWPTRSRAWHPPCADDAVAVEFGRRGPELIPLPFALRLPPASAAYYGEDAGTIEVQIRSQAATGGGLRVAARRRREWGAPARQGRGLSRLLAHAYSFGLNDERDGAE